MSRLYVLCGKCHQLTDIKTIGAGGSRLERREGDPVPVVIKRCCHCLSDLQPVSLKHCDPLVAAMLVQFARRSA